MMFMHIAMSESVAGDRSLKHFWDHPAMRRETAFTMLHKIIYHYKL
jgi:hypothetical protein